MTESDRTASLMTPAKLRQVKAQPAASPAAWLDKLAADAGAVHLQRVVELRSDLLANPSMPDTAALAAQIDLVDTGLSSLDFGLLDSRGWWARTTGKSRSTGVEFAGQFEKADEAVRGVAPLSAALQQAQRASAAATERMLVELEVECAAIDKIVEQGARWLQDMRNQLKTRQAQAPDAQAQQQIREDAARCEILVARLNMLQGASAAARKSQESIRAASAHGAALVQLLNQPAAVAIKYWKQCLCAAAAAASESGKVARPQEPVSATRELRQALAQVRNACEQMRTQQAAVAQSLDDLDRQLASAA